MEYLSLKASKSLSSFFLKDEWTLSRFKISPSIKDVLIASSVNVSISILTISSLLNSFDIPSSIPLLYSILVSKSVRTNLLYLKFG